MASEGDDLPELTVGEGPAPATLTGLPGERYQAVARLGAGAFGEVFRARDSVLGRDVAVKRIRLEAFAEPAQLEEVKRRFLREAQVAARLRHPNIVTTHDILSTPATSLIVMELVEGETLQARLRARGPLSLAETLGLLGQVAAALDHAHSNGVVHRDVKPANVMIEPSGHVKVMDFGIAKVEAGANLTSTGLILGTPYYMSPEQARGEKVDGRSDLFSLGCVLYECLAGRRPFEAETVPGILVKILTESPPPLGTLPAGMPPTVEAVLARAMAKEPSARFATGAEMIDALRAAGPAGAASASVPLPAATAPAGEPSRRLRRGLVAFAAVLLLAAVGWLVGRPRPAPPAGNGEALVAEEDPGLLGRLLGRSPRLLVTLPTGTPFRLALESPLSSETAVTGDTLAAETTGPVRIEGVVAIPPGSRLTGRVRHAASAAQAAGRGEMTLEFDAIALPDGTRASIRTRPLGIRAPAARKKDNAIGARLSEVGAAVGGLFGGRKGAAAGSVVGGAAGSVVVSTTAGREVSLAARAPLTVELLEPVRLSRPRQP